MENVIGGVPAARRCRKVSTAAELWLGVISCACGAGAELEAYWLESWRNNATGSRDTLPDLRLAATSRSMVKSSVNTVVRYSAAVKRTQAFARPGCSR